MKLFVTFFLVFITYHLNAQNTYKTKETEHSEYNIFLLGIKVGEATLKKTLETKESQNYYHLIISGKTTGFAHFFYNVTDEWATHIDIQTFFPILFYRNIQENKYKKNETISFIHSQKIIEVKNKDHNTGQAKITKKYTTKEPLHDILSGIHLLKYKNYDTMENGSIFAIKGFWEDTTYTIHIKFTGKENIKTERGKINAIGVALTAPENSVFEKKDPIQIWFSNDQNRTLLKIKTKMTIGHLDINIKK